MFVRDPWILILECYALFKMVLSWWRNLDFHFCEQLHFSSIWFEHDDLLKSDDIFVVLNAWWCYWHAWFHFLNISKFHVWTLMSEYCCCPNLCYTQISTCCVWFVVILMLHREVPLARLLIVSVWSCLCDDWHCYIRTLALILRSSHECFCLILFFAVWTSLPYCCHATGIWIVDAGTRTSWCFYPAAKPYHCCCPEFMNMLEDVAVVYLHVIDINSLPCSCAILLETCF